MGAVKESMWDELEGIFQQYLPSGPIPEKAFTVQEYAERYGLPPTTALTRLETLASRGVLKRGRAEGRDARGRRKVRNYYWVEK